MIIKKIGGIFTAPYSKWFKFYKIARWYEFWKPKYYSELLFVGKGKQVNLKDCYMVEERAE